MGCFAISASAEHNTHGVKHNTYRKEGLINISSGTALKSKVKDVSVDSFWISLKHYYPKIIIRLWTFYFPSPLHVGVRQHYQH
jgi:hypothetical protein